ncbi:multidrug effflux MFS transporter [Pelagibaculum spongiae]|uniref:Bcr/CflA family efflux transporter n=1 Tax=Pelagibaculum spongiae TaxID=2080658 RepID=A0A2V1GX29_9GAMM|nr:multidrug effflux MFS transporter [Pelagibaculum spongiae]PVZ71731.1 Bcr/CflA family drug resistance efflux transporter [Pelagibaculum spongiae]
MRLSNPLPLFMLMVLFSPLAIDIFLPAIPQMAQALSVPVAWIQQSLPMFMLSFGTGQLIAGPLADRYGRRPIGLIGVLLYIITSSIAASADVYWVLMAARLGQGLAASCLSVAAFAGVRDFFGAQRSGAMFSYLNGVICIVPAVAPLLGGLLTVWWGWESNFWFMAGYGLIMLAALTAMLPETRPANTSSEGKLFSWNRYQAVLTVPVFIFYATLALLGMAMIIGYVTQSPSRLMIDMGLSARDYALWFGANAVVNITCAFAAPKLIEKVGKKTALWGSVSVMAVAAVAEYALGSIMHPLAFMGPVFTASVGFATMMAVCAGNALAPFGDRAGTASALLGLFQMTGAAIVVACLAGSQMLAVEQLSLMMLLPWVWVVVNRMLRGRCMSAETGNCQV